MKRRIFLLLAALALAIATPDPAQAVLKRYRTTGTIEVITPTEGTLWGGVVLGTNLAEHIAHVTIDNLRIERWFDAGITTPINLESDENSYVTLRNNTITDVDTTGIRLTTWVWNSAPANGPSGWRGGCPTTRGSSGFSIPV